MRKLIMLSIIIRQSFGRSDVMVSMNLPQFGFDFVFDPSAFNYYLSMLNFAHLPGMPTNCTNNTVKELKRDVQIKQQPMVKKQEQQLPYTPQSEQNSNKASESKLIPGEVVNESSVEWFEEEMRSVKSRNILPNIINLIVSYIRRVNKSGRVVKRIIEKFGMRRYSLKKFYSYQLYLKEAISDFNTKNLLHLVITFCDPTSSVFRVEEQMFYNMVCRTLIAHYLKVEGPLGLLTSKKEHKTKKKDHFKIYRYILHDLVRYYRDQKAPQK